ncbi:unnamed protein product [Thelazia callipaeda]|uniref:RING finger protein 113A n=1 Tax=Thelazia callipaeda TaxID=103827 RepID=A0A0N5D5Y7_THECL|nr:unnamed protein product [Thelazia callipaeda]
MSDRNEDEASSSSAVFRSRRGAKRNVSSRRERISNSSDSVDSGEGSNEKIRTVGSRKKRKNPMIQSTVRRKICRTKNSSSNSSSSGEDDKLIRDDPLHVVYKSSGTAERAGPSDMGATAVNEIDTDVSHDAQAQFERVQQVLKEGLDDKVYRGAALYGAKEKKDTVWGNASSGLNRFGPIRAPNFLRQSVRWDFAPDICKDYKETGFCTFGDSCKFLHDRTDYKHGWEMERDYTSGRMNENDADKYRISSEDEDDNDDSNLPFKCFICRQSFVNPVVTNCKHYFCEKCALSHFQKSPKCYVCECNTMGIFKVAKGENLISSNKCRSFGTGTEDENLIAKLKENEMKQEDAQRTHGNEFEEIKLEDDDS